MPNAQVRRGAACSGRNASCPYWERLAKRCREHDDADGSIWTKPHRC